MAGEGAYLSPSAVFRDPVTKHRQKPQKMRIDKHFSHFFQINA